jgi:hypothetical protein
MFTVVLQISLRYVGFTWFVLLRLVTQFFIVHLFLYCVVLGTLIVVYFVSFILIGFLWFVFFSLTLQTQFGPWPTSIKLSVSLWLTRARTFGRTPWAGDQLVTRPLTCTQTQKNAHTRTPNIHALSGIRIHDPGFRASEDRACLRPLGYRDRHILAYFLHFFKLNKSMFGASLGQGPAEDNHITNSSMTSTLKCNVTAVLSFYKEGEYGLMLSREEWLLPHHLGG